MTQRIQWSRGRHVQVARAAERWICPRCHDQMHRRFRPFHLRVEWKLLRPFGLHYQELLTKP